MMRLTGWQKIGVLMSIVWAIGAASHARNEDVEQAESLAKLDYRVCAQTKILANDGDLASCDKEKIVNTEKWMKDSDKNVAFAALFPIPFGWLAGLILIYVCRIQVAGFKAEVSWSTLSRLKKGFAILCFVALGVALLFTSMTVLNLYVDTKVPVALSPFLDVMKTGDDLVRAKGTWTRHGPTEQSSMGYPLQTSTIDCDRVANRCVEARASVAGNVLTSELVEYDVQSWTKDAIVLKNDLLCAEEIYTIDLNTKAVSGSGRRTNSDTTFCKLSPSTETEWAYRLEKGFPIYWGIRSKARPMMLRLIQTAFGN